MSGMQSLTGYRENRGFWRRHNGSVSLAGHAWNVTVLQIQQGQTSPDTGAGDCKRGRVGNSTQANTPEEVGLENPTYVNKP